VYKFSYLLSYNYSGSFTINCVYLAVIIAITLCVSAVSLAFVGRKKKRPAKKAKGRDADEASGSEDDGDDRSSVAEKVTQCS